MNQFCDVTRMDDRDVETTPLVNANKVAYCFGSKGQHRDIVAGEDQPSSRRNGCLDHANNIGDRKTSEQGPHGEVLETSGRRRELVAEGIVLHVNPNQVIEPWGWEAEDARHFFSVEEVGRFVPVNPHSSQIISKEIVKRVA